MNYQPALLSNTASKSASKQDGLELLEQPELRIFTFSTRFFKKASDSGQSSQHSQSPQTRLLAAHHTVKVSLQHL